MIESFNISNPDENTARKYDSYCMYVSFPHFQFSPPKSASTHFKRKRALDEFRTLFSQKERQKLAEHEQTLLINI